MIDVVLPDVFTGVAHGINLSHLPFLCEVLLVLQLDRIKDLAGLCTLCRSTLHLWTCVRQMCHLSLHAYGFFKGHNREEYIKALHAIGPVVEDILIDDGGALSEESKATSTMTTTISVIVDDYTDSYRAWWESMAWACFPQAQKLGCLKFDVRLHPKEGEFFILLCQSRLHNCG